MQGGGSGPFSFEDGREGLHWEILGPQLRLPRVSQSGWNDGARARRVRGWRTPLRAELWSSDSDEHRHHMPTQGPRAQVWGRRAHALAAHRVCAAMSCEWLGGTLAEGVVGEQVRVKRLVLESREGSSQRVPHCVRNSWRPRRRRKSPCQHKRPETGAAQTRDAELRLAVATRYAGSGMPSKPVGRLVSPGPAPITTEGRALMERNFPPHPPHQHDNALLASPPSAIHGGTNILQAAEHFARGSSACPSGHGEDGGACRRQLVQV